MPSNKIRVLIAGIAGASLGTELAKAFNYAGGYEILGCDISPYAFGHYDSHFDKTFLVERDEYSKNILEICVRERIDCVIPGGDAPAVLIGKDHGLFANEEIKLAQNNPLLTDRLSHKGECFKILADAGIRTPRTLTVEPGSDISDFPMPCIVKPAVASGGSVFVFFVRDRREALIYCSYLRDNGHVPLLQQYLPEDGGEFTVGVLSLPDGSCAGAIALKRAFHSKLSTSMRGPDFLISSGYSQGEIASFPSVCETAETIAEQLGSTGPLNVQGRISTDGVFVPFEVNARFSASTYLRTLAGFNEVDFYVRHLLGLAPNSSLTTSSGWYLRSLAETVVSPTEVVK